MKRPEGFGHGKSELPPPAKRRVPRPLAQGVDSHKSDPHKSDRTESDRTKPDREDSGARRPEPAKRAPSKPTPTKPVSSRPSGPSAKKQLRSASRERRQFERSEVKRFTRRARHRRRTWFVVLAIMVSLIGIVAIAVYSPLLALRTITIEGASRVDATQVHNAVDGQIGTPLALVDLNRITEELAKFSAIRSYVTEIVPPNALVIRIVERQAIGSLATATGFDLVDPAGVVLSSSPTRAPGVPLIDLGGAKRDSAAFSAATAVIQALPAALLAQVGTVTATTKDDVTLVLTSGNQRVLWGNSERSDYKARVLSALIAQKTPNVVQYDVSAPDSAVITRG